MTGVRCFFILSVLYASARRRARMQASEFRMGVSRAQRYRPSGASSGWHPAQVPGVVQTDLLAAHLIPDPFYGDNESRLQWIGLTDWEYRTTFQVDAATLQHEHVDLVFDGLDTYAEVFLNEQPVLDRGQHVPALADRRQTVVESRAQTPCASSSTRRSHP